MFRFKTGDADSPRAGPPTESPYLLSPVGRENPLGNTIVSPKRAPRKIARSPFKVGAVTWCSTSTDTKGVLLCCMIGQMCVIVDQPLGHQVYYQVSFCRYTI